jgi:ABC-type glycerol-3-phosphate transport system permease component
MNNFFVYIIPDVSAFYVVLIKTYVEQLPASLEESAFMDGATFFTVFTHIILPLSIPIIATVAVFTAVGQWNSWFDNYIYCGNDENLKTLQYTLYNYLNETQRIAQLIRENPSLAGNSAFGQMKLTPKAVRMTVTMLVTLPILFVYPFMQRFFIKGIMLGAIKG